MNSCAFCLIATGAAPAHVVHEEEDFLAFLDIEPVAPGHVLVVPRGHFTGFTDLPLGLATQLWSFAHAASRALLMHFPDTEGLNLLLSQGAAAQQSVFHTHLHVIPRRVGDGMTLCSTPSIVSHETLRTHAALLQPTLSRWQE